MKGHQEGVRQHPAQQEFGRANPCPNCGGAGFLDHIDIIDRIQYEHCPECGHKWSQTEDELTQV